MKKYLASTWTYLDKTSIAHTTGHKSSVALKSNT
jgi:hypothetical protein